MASLLLRSGVGAPPSDVAGVVEWFGAMQAQDINSGLWSLGARLPGMTQDDVWAALERREAIRTWPMRGTVHFVPPRDAHWMLELTGVRALAGAAARRVTVGLTEELADKAVRVLGAALAGGGRFTRDDCVAALAAAGIELSGQARYHILWYASQKGVLCVAPHVGKEQTFVLLDEWVPQPRRPSRDEALAILAVRYFRSHGPTTRQDFAGWTGLPAADAKRGIAAAGDALTTVRVDGVDMVVDPVLLDATPAALADDEVRALPGFDEYLLGFKDRSLMVDAAHKQAIVPGGNGVFQSTVVRTGRVVGTWKRSTGKTRTVVRVLPLVALTRKDRARVEAAFEPYARFIDHPVEVRWP
ncbi:winged helix DNA-binding domain-containing protein [Plantactinospora sp. GCM10030261]|uniref:winged helix DNA-binding domain-containing protein n=1 Tax=Plantactinospora sp. GCM10030261 TaxID=3273420 RepID=UPI003612DBC4